MEFYRQIAKYYDDIFPFNEKQFNVLKEMAGNTGNRILDIACATGTYVSELRKLGFEAYGIDLNETMIQLAQTKVNSKDIFLTANMLDLSDYFTKPFNFIYCIGNSLVHLNNEEEVFQFFKNTYNLLLDTGSLLIQIINFDRIIDQYITSLPTIKKEEKNLEFVRNYVHENKYILFNTKLTVNQEIFYNSVPLLPLKEQVITSMLNKIGFNNIEYYGDYQLNPYNPKDSFHLIIKAQK